MVKVILRQGVVMPSKRFCASCDCLMRARPNRDVSALVCKADWRPLLDAKDRDALRALYQTADAFECHGLSFACPTCDACGSGYGYKYTEDEAQIAADWHNAEDYANTEEKAWAERHRRIPGYQERFIATIIGAFPEWARFLTCDEEKGKTYPLFEIPDPVPERGRDLRLDTRFPYEVLAECRGTHTHFGVWERDSMTWREAEAEHFENLIQMIRRLINEELMMYELRRAGRHIGGGAFALNERAESARVPLASESGVMAFLWSWRGTYDSLRFGVQGGANEK